MKLLSIYFGDWREVDFGIVDSIVMDEGMEELEKVENGWVCLVGGEFSNIWVELEKVVGKVFRFGENGIEIMDVDGELDLEEVGGEVEGWKLFEEVDGGESMVIK